MKRAACKGIDPDLFMPVRGENLKIKKAKLAQIYDTHGIFGGWTRQQRSKELRRLGLSQRRWGSGGPQNMKHGTKLGYLTHMLAGETPCTICVEAETGQPTIMVK